MATYYIATTGNDTTGDGSSGNPWLTLAKFLSSSTSGDTCICGAGTYTFATATIASRTIYAASPSAPAIFNATGAVVWTVTSSTIRNCKFTNTGTTMFTCNAATFEKCQFVDLIYINNNDGHALFSHTSVAANVNTSLIGCLIDNPTRHASSTFYLALFGFRGPTSSTLTLTNNIISIETMSAAFGLIGGNNTGTLPITVNDTNNIFLNSSGQNFNFTQFTGGSTVTTGGTSRTNCRRNINTGWPAGTGNITSDPLFVDATNSNFNLRPTSPCINTGTLV